IQDVRLWGSEGNTLGDFSANGLDVHQAYIDLGKAEDGGFLGRFGRQEVNFGGQRLIGSVNWAQQARSFDGIRVGSGGSVGNIDVFAAKLADSQAGDVDVEADLVSAYGTWDITETQDLDLYWIYDHREDDEAGPGDQKTNRHTFGARWVGNVSGFVYRAEGSYQSGTLLGTDVSAFMIGGRLAHGFAGKGGVTLWYDYLSGDGDLGDDKLKVFDTLFATNHKFYGFADLFLNIPLDTGGRGLQDIAVKGTYRFHPAWLVRLDLHSFHMADKGPLTSGHFGEEIDVVASWRYNRYLNLSAGVAYVFQGDGWAEIGRLAKDMGWVYLMLDARF
ncbi:MAG: alginate export family protein, partial [Gemmatimonadetes bacterium]|nr:alginate export family protein [Gemmatimonadota bacterium]